MATYLAKYFLAALIIISACHLAPARARDAPAPFDGDPQRLAENPWHPALPAAFAGANEAFQMVRNEMQALIDAETPSGDHPHDRRLQPRL